MPASAADASAASSAPGARAAVSAQSRTIGSPIAERWAMKFRLPNVPPGARLMLK